MLTATILVVDDNVPALKGTARLLKQAGYEVVTAADGAEALRQCRAHHPDLVLLDVMLPDIPGLEVLRQIRLDPDLAGAGVVMLSAMQIQPEQQAVGLDSGADGYLTRPITNTELLARVRAILRQRELTDEVRKSEALHRLLFEANPQPLWVYDLETLGFLAVNDTAVKQYGYSREEFLRMTIKDIRPPEDVEALLRKVGGVTDGVDHAGIWRHRLKSGAVILVNVTSHTLEFEGRRAEIVLAVDVTEQQAAEAALRKQTDQLVKAQRIAHLGSWELDIPANVLTWSDEVFRIFGIPPEESAGTYEAFLARVHPDDRATMASAQARVLAGLGPLEVEHRIIHPDGSIRHVVERGELVRDDQGVASALSGTIQDITERKQTEVELMESEERFRSLLQSVPSVAIQGYALDGAVQYWNEASERFYGYSREEALRGNLLDLIIPPNMRSEVKAALQGVVEGRDIPNGELNLMRKDGSRILVFSSHAVVRRAGHPPELFCIDVDLSDRQRAEEEWRQLINNLRERVKELRALHRAAELLRNDELTTAELLGKVVTLIPPAMQYPAITAARVSFGEVVEATPGFQVTPWCLETAFISGNGTPGRLEVVYLEECPPREEGPFHDEERSLVNSLAEMLRAHFDRRIAEQEIRRANETLQDIVAALQEITRDDPPLG